MYLNDPNISSANATANAFLGSRTPAWMLGGATARTGEQELDRATRRARGADTVQASLDNMPDPVPHQTTLSTVATLEISPNQTDLTVPPTLPRNGIRPVDIGSVGGLQPGLPSPVTRGGKASDLAISQQPSVLMLMRTSHYRDYLTWLQQRIAQDPDAHEFARLRMSMLFRALEQGDAFYTMLHQLLCVRSTEPHLLPAAIREIPPHNYSLIDLLLGQINVVGTKYLQCFASAPVGRSQLPTLEGQEVHQIRNFLLIASEAFETFKSRYEQLATLPIASDIESRFRLPSPTLQEVIFIYIQRSSWGLSRRKLSPTTEAGTPTSASALNLFRESQQIFLQRKVSAKTAADAELELRERESCYRQFHALQQRDLGNTWMQMTSSTHFSGPYANNILLQGSSVAPPGGFAQQTFVQQPSVEQAALPATSTTPVLQIQKDSSLVPSNAPRLTTVLNGRSLPPVPSVSGAPVRSSRGALSTHHSPQVHSTASLSAPTRERRTILPRPGEVAAQLARPDPSRYALHQVHLTTPTLARKVEEVSMAEQLERLYQYVHSYAVGPVWIEQEDITCSWSFDLTTDDVALIPQDTPGSFGVPSTRTITESSKTYRLRCCKFDTEDSAISENQWAASETTWPTNAYFRINGYDLEVRRKVHFGRDLPVDITRFVRQGLNSIEVAMDRILMNGQTVRYGVAVEVSGFVAHTALMKQCWAQTISEGTVIETIKRKLTREAAADDELIITNSNLTINLIDPLSSGSICETPVRGVNCLHLNCVELTNYLGSGKANSMGIVSEEDFFFRCPLCFQDLRPQSMIIDGFLVSVRKKLAEQGALGIFKEIIVEADGIWHPKGLDTDHQRSERYTKAPVVIDLSD